ncbi:DNA helicase [Tanacetum coccineum]
MFAMTLFGAKVDDSVNNGNGPYVFKASGQIYHWIGSFCPEEGHHPRFLQLYIYDTQAEVSNRIRNFKGREEDTLNPDIVEGYYPELLLKPKNSRGRGRKVIMNMYYKYQLHPRSRLDFIRKRQRELRSDYLLGLYNAISQGDCKGIQAGSMEPTQIDDYISAELPDPVEDPIAYKVITELMMHVPCGVANPSAVCTEKGICNKGFQKMYNDKTFFDINGHTYYRRRQTEVHFMKGESRLDNCNVVPYNRMLCLAFHAHINVEYCGWSMLINNLFKYISKGPDLILGKIDRNVGNPSSSTVEKHIQVDEIKNYVDGRFICPFEACWRIFDYPIHRREPAVQILNVHLENMQRVNFRERDRHLTYLDFPSEFVWYTDSKSWHRRVIRKKNSIGRLTYVHPNSGDLFYFRMLMSHRKGCKSPIDVRTVNGQVLPTYRAACEALGLLGDDKEWDIALEESGVSATSAQLRTLFAQILLYCSMADPRHILYELEATLNGFGKFVKEFRLPTPPEYMLKDLKNKLLMEEKNCRRHVLLQESSLSVPKLNEEHKQIYNFIMNASLRSHGKIVLAVASSDIASHFSQQDEQPTLESYLWPDFKVCTLKQNMRLLRSDLSDEERERSKLFAQWLLDVGNGEIGYPDKDNGQDTFWITVLQEYCISPSEHVCPKNDAADTVNANILASVEGVTKTYLSRDEAIQMGRETSETKMLYPIEYLNMITFPGFPPHELQLKVGSPIMLLRNMNLSRGLCNGTRMIIISLMSKLIEAQIITGTRVGEKVYIHRIPLTDKDPNLSFTFKRTQFPVKLCYAMTINKSQGHSFSKIGVYLTEPVSFTAMAGTTITSLRVGREDCVIEAKVYRKWTSKSIPEMKDIAFCCILIDRENNAIQASMDLRNTEYFNRKLKLNTVYRISDFICENTKPYQQTLQNKISLRFGKITSFEVLLGKESEFPDHHFEFISYNQLPSRVPYEDEQTSKMVYPILSDYLGWIRSISDLTPSRDANTGQKYRRKVDIESLDGNVVEFTMFDDPAKQFNKQEIDKLPHPIIIAVSSCRVSKYRGGDVQLVATPATHYYINPRFGEAADAYTMFKEKYNQNPPLRVINYRYQDPEQEKARNRQTLYILLQQNPTSFKDVRFTCDAMITSFNGRRSWSYPSCSQCKKLSTKINDIDTCEDHGKQTPPTYRYNFKATVADSTATAEFTFFTKAGQKITDHSCSDVMQKFEATDKTKLPVELVNTIGLMTHASINKDKGADTQLATSIILTIQDSTSKDNSMPAVQEIPLSDSCSHAPISLYYETLSISYQPSTVSSLRNSAVLAAAATPGTPSNSWMKSN